MGRPAPRTPGLEAVCFIAHSQAPLEQCHRLSLQQPRKIGKRSTPGRVQFWLLFTRSKKIKPPKTKGINWKIQPSGPGLETSFIGLTFHPFQAQNPSPLLILELLVSSPRNPVHLNNTSVCSQPFPPHQPRIYFLSKACRLSGILSCNLWESFFCNLLSFFSLTFQFSRFIGR